MILFADAELAETICEAVGADVRNESNKGMGVEPKEREANMRRTRRMNAGKKQGLGKDRQ